MSLQNIDTMKMKPANQNLRIKYGMITALLLCALLLVALISTSHAAEGESGTSSGLLSVTKTIILKAAKLGLDEAGTRIMGSAWPYLKIALEPLFEELKHRIPAFSRLEESPGPANESLANNAVREISSNPILQNMIIDGFANLKQGQRDILKQLGSIEKSLAQQNETLRDFEASTNQKFNEIISLLREQRKQPNILEYTGGVTMYDIEGIWTLVKEDPPGCPFEDGDFGLIIEPINAFEARGSYELQTLPSLMPGISPEVPEDKKVCVSFPHKNEVLQLYGTILRIPFTDTLYFSREVKRSGCVLTLSWFDDQGVKRHWYFWKSGCS